MGIICYYRNGQNVVEVKMRLNESDTHARQGRWVELDVEHVSVLHGDDLHDLAYGPALSIYDPRMRKSVYKDVDDFSSDFMNAEETLIEIQEMQKYLTPVDTTVLVGRYEDSKYANCLGAADVRVAYNKFLKFDVRRADSESDDADTPEEFEHLPLHESCRKKPARQKPVRLRTHSAAKPIDSPVIWFIRERFVEIRKTMRRATQGAWMPYNVYVTA